MVVTDIRSSVVKHGASNKQPSINKEPSTMRRVIAEDPDWSLATVPMLKDLCINHIVDNFQSK